MTPPVIVANPRQDRSQAVAAARRLLPDAGFREAWDAITGWPGYAPTPLLDLDGLAREIGVARLLLKDEAGRFGLGSFKALGGAYAVYRALARAPAGGDGATPMPAELIARAASGARAPLTVACATDGNHGRSVAWGARQLGCRCVIYLHAGVSAGREAAIAALGAETRRAGATYDEATRRCAEDAAREGWTVVSDTAPEHSEAGPALDIMQGYRVLAEEVARQSGPEATPTHVFLQVGCGGFAAAIAAHLVRDPAADVPVIVAVEPDRAACLAVSVAAGQPVQFEGDLDTLMAGLSVGEVSLPAWDVLSPAVAGVVVVPDDAAVTAMRALAAAAGGDPPVVAGESGAAGLAGLLALDGGARSQFALDASSRVLVISTEGATDPEIYERLVGRPAAAVPRSVVER